MDSPLLTAALLLLCNAAAVVVAFAWLKRRERRRPDAKHPALGSILPFALAVSFALFMVAWSALRQVSAQMAAIACGVPLIILLSATADLVRRRSVRIVIIAAAVATAAGWSFLLYAGG